MINNSSSPSYPAENVDWVLNTSAPVSELESLVKELSIPPLLASILWARGFQTQANIRDELEPPLKLTNIPDLLTAASRLEHALKNKERIVIHGDYDADGITGTAVLTLGLRALGGKVTPFLPNRITDGYGISPKRLNEHIEKADLFITVDCGITNLVEIKDLQDAGVEVIVTDHHHIGSEKPDCLIVHPKTAPDAIQDDPALTGSGVAYHLLWALHNRLKIAPPLEYSDLAAIGIIADVAPLLGENRALVREGLKYMADSHWVGIRACMRQAKLTRPKAQDVAFVIAPRLNAAGRLGEAEVALELLMTASERRARELAVYTETQNIERKKIQSQMLTEALEQVDKNAPAIVLVDKENDRDWNPGIMGLVASNVLEQLYKPVFIIAKGKGSVRSTVGISAVEALNYTKDLLERFGGHSQAAGFAINEANIAAFRQKIYDFVSQYPTPKKVVKIDAVISGNEVDKDIYEALKKLEPCGQGHPLPIFALADKLAFAKAVGKTNKHLQLRVGNAKGVIWNKGAEAKNYLSGDNVQVTVILKENHWQGKTNVEFQGQQLRSAEYLGFNYSKDCADPVNARSGSDNSGSVNSIKRSKPADLKAVHFYGEGNAENLPMWSIEQSIPAELWLKDLPLNSSLLSTTEPLQEILAKQGIVYFDLSANKLAKLENLCSLFPNVQDLRLAFVYLQRGQTLPFHKDKAELCLHCLKEIELLDNKGFIQSGQKRDPYSSITLRKSLLERYKLFTFINSYRHFDEIAFAHTVRNLFSKVILNQQ